MTWDEQRQGISYHAMAMAIAAAIMEQDDLTDTQKEAIFRAALMRSPKAQRGEDIEFDVMVIMATAEERRNGA